MSPSLPSAYADHLRKRGFLLEEFIARGAYGKVYKADQPSLRRPVAVKFFDSRFAKGDANRKRFQREAALLARVEHPCVPYVITSGVIEEADGSVPYTVMQYIAGRSLHRHIENQRTPDAGFARAVMRDVLSALACAHRNAVVHRDVKPDNIVLSGNGTYLLDFSIGICLVPAPGLTRATVTGDRVGTELYAAPEQRRDSSAVDARADVYSAGVVLAELLGARPRLDIGRLDATLGHVAKSMRDVIRCAAADEPQDRFASATEFLAAFEQAFHAHEGQALDAQVVLCPNARCDAGRWSNGSGMYYWGPKVGGPTLDRYCESCGAEYLRGCTKCHVPLPSNIAKLVSKEAKSELDALAAHCSRCGNLLFRTPTCCECGSYFTGKELRANGGQGKCGKCASRQEAMERLGSGELPF